MTNSSPFGDRLERARKQLQDRGADALVCFPSTNMYYLSGFEDEPMERHLFLFVTPETTLFVAPDMYVDQIKDESHVTDIRSWSDGDDPTTLIQQVGSELELSGGHLLVDDRMWALFTQDLHTAFPKASFGLASEVTERLRIKKDAAELAALREAASISDTVSKEVRMLGADVVGMTEAELATEIETRLSEAGGEDVAFETIVGSGPNGARPHHRSGDRTIEAGDPVVLDFGTQIGYYPGDQTRTVVFDGEPPAAFEAVYDAVLEAHNAAVEAVEPGVSADELDRVAREVLMKRGFGEQFIHRTGHGVGLDVHEPPYITADNDRELESGMVFSIEPGVYLEDEFGVRIEDLVVVTENGHERLNDSPRTWQAL